MTEEQYTYLKQFEDRFIRLKSSDYCASIKTKDLEEIKKIYEELSNRKFTGSLSCSSCVVKLLRKISKYYFDYGENRQITES